MSTDSKPLRVGFVGLSTQGWASNALAPGLLAPSLKDKYTLTAVSTTSEESAKATAKKYTEELGHPVKAFFGDSSKIASDPDVDLVVVSVKTPHHKSALTPVIEAGKPFFIEWPAGNKLAESKELAEAAGRKGLKGIVGLQGRQGLVINKVKEILSSGKIGAIRSSQLIALFPQELKGWGPKILKSSIYANTRANGATGLHIGGGHILDTFQTVLGKFTNVSATAFNVYNKPEIVDDAGNPTGETIDADNLDFIAFSGVLASGALASVTLRTGLKSTPGRSQFVWEIDGEEGSIRIDSPDVAFINVREPNLYVNGERVEVEAGELLSNITRQFEEYAKGEAGNYATLEDAVKLHELLDAIERSAKEGKRISL